MPNSQNGWVVIPSYGDSRLISNPKVPGTSVQLLGGVLAGDVATVLLWVAQRFNETVEPLIAGQCWGYEPRPIRGSSEWSNHASGTGIDLNSVKHGLGASGTFTAAQVKAIRAILAACDGVIRWGGDYDGRKDEMHFEINGTAAKVAAVVTRLGREPAKPAPTPTKPTQPDTRPSLEGLTMILRRDEFGVDYMWTDTYGPASYAEIIPNKGDYDLLYALGTIDKPHGQAIVLDRSTIRWQFKKIEASGGVIGQGGAMPVVPEK